ncbi:LysR family transcriptional regulator [Thalassomonas haliotis]|uniref:LysR family transcriptional regulator n=1 Tax=Thalassomonas haliotis TaxID=485448 RepID=A0ABY7VJA0_9GAMM|nr:LysR family transcriptional regulator [Thalassomonas haliotis]WDE12747.1 LysR family transcriptional regulator [Thalassomonas haliotis]
MDKVAALTSFVEVANTGSFTRAAEQLELSRVKVTRHVQELESWLNIRLFHRTTRKVTLTAPGQDMMLHCQRILNEVAGLESLARSHDEELIGEIRIATPIGFGQNLLYEQVESFTARHPKVVIQLMMSDRNAQLVDERIDVALRFSEQVDEGLIARRLMAIESAVCCSAQYVLEHGQVSTPEQLTQHNCLIHISQRRWSFLAGQQLTRVPVSGSLCANDLGVLVRAALNGAGIVYLPCDLANPYLKSGQLIQLLPDVPLPVMSLWAVYLSRSYQRPVVRAFIDFLLGQWQQDLGVFKN